MIALPHRRPAQPPPPVKFCGSDALFMVLAADEGMAVCAPCLPKYMTNLRLAGESPLHFEIGPGRRCEFVPEVKR